MCLATMDESGDTGLRLGAGSSERFTIGMVLFQEEAEADACKASIRALRRSLGMKLTGKEAEFHFRDRGKAHREAFLSAVAPFPFKFYIGHDHQGPPLRAKHGARRSTCTSAGVLAIDQALPNMLEAKLLFDATSGRLFDWEFLRFLTKHAGYYDGLPVIKESLAWTRTRMTWFS